MKIAFVGEHSYRQYLDKLEFPKDMESFSSVADILTSTYEAIVLVEHVDLTSSNLIRIRQMNPTAKILFIQTSDSDRLQVVCAAQHIDMMPDDFSEDRFKQYIEKLWFSIKASLYKNVIAFFGTHPQAGTSSTAFSVAHQILRKNRTVCLLNLNLYNPSEFPEKPSEYSLNTIYQTLVSGQTEKVKDVMVEVDGVPVLIGNCNPLQVQAYEIEPLKGMIDYLKEEFDYVVIDAGAMFDNAGSLVSMMCSGTKIIVATQQEISIRNFNRNYEYILGKLNFDIDTFHLVVNKYMGTASYTPDHLAMSLKLNLLENIPFYFGAEDKEVEVGYLIGTGEKDYDRAIIKVVNGVIAQIDSSFTINAEPKSKKKFLGII